MRDAISAPHPPPVPEPWLAARYPRVPCTGNLHVREGVEATVLVTMRAARARALPMPKRVLPALRVNLLAKHLSEPEDESLRELELPVEAP